MLPAVRGVTDLWAVVPAAGTGRRMQTGIPKQYLRLGQRTVIEHALCALCEHPRIAGVVVATAPDDRWWSQLRFEFAQPPQRVDGGPERRHSVLNGLRALNHAAADDWVLVHDAARPCLTRGDIDRLIGALADHPVGGLLGVPLTDTVKRADTGDNVIETVDRRGLWRALTPQMFRVGMLTDALDAAIRRGEAVTDEASAIERTGRKPMMVEGRADNIKITQQRDLDLAALYLQQQQAGT